VGKDRRTVRIHYEGRDDYLSSTTYLVGSENGNAIEILPGLHTYSFSCTLPHQIPTSFEGQHGHIRYTIRLSLERPWKFDHVFRVAFTVLKPYDLNYDTPILKIPSQMEVSRSFCCGPCKSGPLLVIGTIPQSGYVPGQMIFVTAEIVNSSNVEISHLTFSLKKNVIYYCQSPRVKSRREVDTVIEKRVNGVAKHDSARFEQKLLIPSVPPTNISYCRVIHITYNILIKLYTSGTHFNPNLEIPITIGTVPLNMTLNTIQAISNPNEMPTNTYPHPNEIMPHPIQMPMPMPMPNTHIPRELPIASSVHGNDIEVDPSLLPPPSYEESVYGTQHVQENDKDNNEKQVPFNPRYPVYHFPN
jgi:hypothetical protein